MVGFSNMRRGPINGEKVKELAEKRHESIVAKCHPAIFELAQLGKEIVEGLNTLPPNPPPQLVAEIEARLERRTEEIHRRYSGTNPPPPNTFAAQSIFSEEALTSESDGQGVAEWMHWKRHRTPAKQDAQKSRAKDWEASKRLQRTSADFEQVRCGKGPVQHFKNATKDGLEHSTMFEILWGLGLEKFTPEELADFFDSYCPCGSDGHDPEALKKQRDRFRKTVSVSTS